MEAVHLIEDTRQALGHGDEVAVVVAQAWQAQALVEAMGSHLAVSGPPAVRAEAVALSEAGRHGCVALRHEGQGAEGVRAARLTRIRDPEDALTCLATLLGETGTALVGVAVAAAEVGLYWQCIEAIDAADESGDRVARVLRGLALPERGPAA